jgi:hypothetical protein
MASLDPTTGMRRSQLYRRHINNKAVFKTPVTISLLATTTMAMTNTQS